MQIAKIEDQPLPTAEVIAPTLADWALHKRLLSDVPRKVAPTLGPDMIPELQAYLAEARRLCQPATDVELVRELDRLFNHFHEAEKTEADQAKRWADWLEDFSDVPLDVLKAAIRAWRRSRQRWSPSPGQLLGMIGGENHWGRQRLVLLRRAEQVLELMTASAGR